MADGLTTTTTVATIPTATKIATDDAGASGHVQFVKLAIGTDGSATAFPGDATDGLLVNLGANNDVTVTGTVDLGATDNAVLDAIAASVAGATPAGTNAIGKLAANSGVDIGDVDVTSVVPGSGATNLGKAEDAAHTSGDVGVMALSVRQDAAAALGGTDADYQPLITDANGRLHVIEPSAAAATASLSVLDDWDNAASDGISASGDVAHDTADAGEPVKVGAKAVDYGATQTAVAANDRTNLFADRSGVQFFLGGHPDIITLETAYAASAQTDTALVTVSAGTAIVVTQIQAVCDEANTVGVGFRVGFGTANTPTTTGVVLTHPGLVPGSGISRGDGSGILGIGASNEDLRVTAEAATGGSIRFLVSYFTIAIG